VVSITSRAGMALGSFYTYFESKDALFRALVRDVSERVKNEVGPVVAAAGLGSIESERPALEAFLSFVRNNKELYRIIDEAEFVAYDDWLEHYSGAAARILERLRLAEGTGQTSVPIDEVHAWAIMGMNVFLGLRFGVWDEKIAPDTIAATAAALIGDGLRAADRSGTQIPNRR